MEQTDVRFREVLENRSEVLRYLVESPTTKPTLVDDLPLSRSTVDRAIDDLIEIDCVTADDGMYTSTTTGRIALAEYKQYQSTTQTIHKATTFLNQLSSDNPVDIQFLKGANITLSEPHAPDHALTSSIEILDQATAMKGLAPVVLSFYPDLLIDRLESGEFTTEIVAEEEVLTTLPDLPSSRSKSLQDYDAVSLYETDAPLPYALWIMETAEQDFAGISAYDSSGVTGILINDSPEAVAWAEAQYQKYRRDAHLHTTNSR